MANEIPPVGPVFFLDSSAIVNGANVPAGESRTAPSIVSEFQEGGATRRRLDLLLAGGLRVESASPASLARVVATAEKAGSRGRLSAADLDVLALALEGGPSAVLVTDDYTMQDVAKRLGVATKSIATSGISTTRAWKARCAGCGRTYPADRTGPCPVCGAEIRLRRRS